MPQSILNLNTIDPRTRNRLFAWYSAKWVNGLRGQNPADAAAIGQWNDLSDGARHLIQGTGANQPTFRLSAGPDGRFPAVRFDATDTMVAATAGASPRPITVVAVWKNTLADSGSTHHALTFNNVRIGLGLDWATNNEFYAVDDAAVNAGALDVAGDTTLWHVHAFVAQPLGPQSFGEVDGLHKYFAGQAGTNTNSDVAMNPNALTCDVAELQVYRDVLPLGELQNLTRSLAHDWGLPMSQVRWQK